MQTDATLLANNFQHCWMLHVASVCTPCCMLLDVVACCCAKLETGQTGCILPTTHCRFHHCWEFLHPFRTLLPKRTQQLPTLLAQQWWELLRPFARSLRYERICLKEARETHLIHKARTIEPLGSNKRDGLYVIIM